MQSLIPIARPRRAQ